MANHSTLQTPKAVAKPVSFTLHGDTRVDEYAWLQDRNDRDVLNYVEAENRYADATMAQTSGLQEQLNKEIRKRMKEDDMSVPIKDGPYLYYSRVEKDKQYAIHCRKKGKNGKEEVYLDENKLAEGQKFFSLGILEVSPDHNLVAYSLDLKGDERHTLFIKDLRNGTLLPDEIEAVEEVAWCADSERFFYTVEDHPHPPRRLFLHRCGSEERDKLIYEEQDLQWYVRVFASRSRKYIFISSSNFESREVWFVPAEDPLAKLRLFAPRKKGVRYGVDHRGDDFYIYTNERALNFKIMRTSVSAPERRFWKDWLPYNAKRPITGMLAFEKFMVISVRQNASEELYIYGPKNVRGTHVKTLEPEHAIGAWGDIEFDSDYIRFTYTSFITPSTVYDYYPAKKKFIIRKQQKAPGWKRGDFVTKREWVKVGNVKVPISLVYKKGLKRDGSAPLLLEAYGSYDVSLDPYFSIANASLLERGWTIAFAHPRGGGELGWSWHKEGYLLKKHNTYRDFIACADFLVDKKYTSRDKLAIIGGSAGGMLIGAVLNMRAHLCKAAIAHVPAADLLTTSLDESLGGTRLHYDETGDPRIPSHYFYMRKWSPYEAVRTGSYPALLVRASMNDIRTPYWEAAKWVSRLRAKKTDDNLLILKTEIVAGHSGKSGRYEWIKDRAFDFAFLIKQVSGLR